MNKSRIKPHFQYSWWVYPVIVAGVSIIWCSVFSGLARPKADEMLNITIIGEVNDSMLSENLSAYLEGKTAKTLKEINIEVIPGSNRMLGDLVAMRCMGDTDLMIFEEDYLLQPMSSNFDTADSIQLQECFSDGVFYEEEGETLGMLLYDGTADCRFSDYYNGNKRFWVFMTPESKDEAAPLAIQYLMERK